MICQLIWNYASIKHIITTGIIISVIFQTSSFLQESLLSFSFLTADEQSGFGPLVCTEEAVWKKFAEQFIKIFDVLQTDDC